VTVRSDVAELLRAGYGDRTIARQTNVSISHVTRARAELGLPKARGGWKQAASVEDLFWRRAKPVGGGHYEWTGQRGSAGTPALSWGGRRGRHYSAYRVAFKIRHGADPIGYAYSACEHPGCVAPGCIADTAVTPRPAHHRNGGGRRNASRDDIIRLIRAGHSNREIGKLLRTDTRHVAAIRAELGLPRIESRTLTFEERWAAHTEPVDGGHVRWTGRLRDGTVPALLHNGRDSSVRRVAFERLHGRPPVGPVRPGCGFGPCVRPEHLEDRPMRQRTNDLYDAIFGAAA
jgi:hypothetical protein